MRQADINQAALEERKAPQELAASAGAAAISSASQTGPQGLGSCKRAGAEGEVSDPADLGPLKALPNLQDLSKAPSSPEREQAKLFRQPQEDDVCQAEDGRDAGQQEIVRERPTKRQRLSSLDTETLPAVEDSKGQLLSGNSLVPSEERPPPSPAKWKYLPDDLIRTVFSKLSPIAQQRSRLVSKNWCAVMDELLRKAVRLLNSRIDRIGQRFPGLRSIDFSRCSDQILRTLSTSGLQIQDLSIRQLIQPSHFTPRVNNVGLGHVAQMTSLQKVVLCDCDNVTDSGISGLATLTHLRELGLIGCSRISVNALGWLPQMPYLQSLTFCRNKPVGEELLWLLAELPALRHVHLGTCKITDYGWASYLHQSRVALEELTLDHMTLDRFFLLELAKRLRDTNLTAVGFSACFLARQMQTQVLRWVLHFPSVLERINLISFTDISDAELEVLAQTAPNLKHLKMAMSNGVTAHGIETLGTLTNLQALSLESSNARTPALQAVSTIGSLICAEFPGSRLPQELFSAVTHLAALKHLDLSGGRSRWKVEMLTSIADCMNLRVLDLSNSSISLVLVEDLLKRLTEGDGGRALGQAVLEELGLQGCGISEQAIRTLADRFPSVLCHTKRPSALASSTFVGSSKVLASL